jgi:hypothetical protein
VFGRLVHPGGEGTRETGIRPLEGAWRVRAA